MQGEVERRGDGLALPIPETLRARSDLEPGSRVDLEVVGGALVATPVDAPRFDLDALIAGITPENRHGEVDDGRPVGGESW